MFLFAVVSIGGREVTYIFTPYHAYVAVLQKRDCYLSVRYLRMVRVTQAVVSLIECGNAVY